MTVQPTISKEDLDYAEKCGIYDDEGYDKILQQLKKYYNRNSAKCFKRGYEHCRKEVDTLLQTKVDKLCDTMYEESICQDIR